MKIYDVGNPAPNPRRVRIFLAEKGIAVPYEPISLMKGEHKAPEFKEKNSLGQVPVLELDDGTHISESISICRYFEALHPEPALFGATPVEIAQIDMWIRRIEFIVMGPVGNVWRHADARTSKIVKQFRDFGEANRETAFNAMRWLDRELVGRDFIAGQHYSVADISALCTIDFAKFIGLEIPADCPNLKAWHARVSARESAAA
ncbi:MAG: glutathione S-transferase family protein [Parvibaculum sp.]|uniref:glutathione S-transferase family protein n=1 Tax=Parvibaculum sp. TaxID=2024848 RepID=UPI003C755A62